MADCDVCLRQGEFVYDRPIKHYLFFDSRGDTGGSVGIAMADVFSRRGNAAD